ncbi:MAG: protein translocase subunit SecF [Nocardioides sp.]
MGKFSRLGNDLYEGRVSVDFVGRKWLWYAMSGLIVLLAVGGLSFKHLDLGIEFVGGAEYRISLPSEKVTQDLADEVRNAVAGTGIDSAASPVVTTSGDSAILVQTEPVTDAEATTIGDVLIQTTGATAGDLSQSEIGASWGREIAQRSLIGLAVFLVLVVLFIWAYFREWKMSVAAMVALIHDVVITIGVYALSGFEVTPATVTGVLTILGFSLYDTVVVFDKVRENTKNLRKTRMTYSEAANLAINQTLVRSVNTSIVALIPVGAILYVGVFQLGSGSLKDLALALFVGMLAGVYSSIFIATPLLAHMKSGERGMRDVERRALAKRRHDTDRYASVPSYRDDLAVRDENIDEDTDEDDETRRPAVGAGNQPATSPRRDPAVNRGRVAPPAHGPVKPSASSGRVQPTRQTRSKRGKK